LPDVLAVVQVALEGKISRKAVEAQLARGHRSAGDLIPWTIAQQFGDSKFAQLSGARIVRVAVHPSVQGMGYGSRAMELLYRFYNGEMISLASDGDDDDDGSENEADKGGDSDDDDDDEPVPGDGIRGESLKPRKALPPLLLPLTEVETPRLDWMGTSFGLTLQLHKFWTRCGMRMLYLRQTKNDLTGEHSAIMVRALPKRSGVDDAWLSAFMTDTRRRLITLLGGPFRDIEIRLALSTLENLGASAVSSEQQAATLERSGSNAGAITADELDYFLTPHDMKRLELYGRNLCDHHLVTDLLPIIARLYFFGRFGTEMILSSVQSALMCGIGLQNKTVDSLTSELGLPANQVLAMFNKAVRKISMALNAIVEAKEKQSMLGGEKRKKAEKTVEKMRDVAQLTLEEDVKDAVESAMEALKANEMATLPSEIAEDHDLMRYVVKGSKEQWDKALEGKHLESENPSTVQIQSTRDKRKALDEEDLEREASNDKSTPSRGSDKKKKSKSSTKKTRR
jgi:N-acetyltransferase 10